MPRHSGSSDDDARRRNCLISRQLILSPSKCTSFPTESPSHVFPMAYLRSNPAYCDAREPSWGVSSSGPSAMTLEEVRREKARFQAELNRLERQSGRNQDGTDRCDSCLYTGVVTCTGLASYFAHLAWNDAAVQPRHRPFLMVLSASWIALGAYRWKLG